MSSAKFIALLNNPFAARKYLLIVSPYDPSLPGVAPLYYSDQGFVTEPSDSPPNTHFEPRLRSETVFRFTRSMFQPGQVGGASVPGFGGIQLINEDGGLDALRDLGWDGRDVELRMGGDGFAFSEYETIFAGVAEQVTVDEQSLTIGVRDYQALLTQPVQATLYQGSGGNEGGDDVKGKPKPLCYGTVRNIEPVLLGVSGGVYLYQFHAGTVVAYDAAVHALYDNGIALTYDASDPPAAGKWTVTTAGLVKYNGTPAGLITMDAKGDASGSGYVYTAADIIRRIAVDQGGLVDPGDLDTASFTALNTANSAVVGLYVREESTIVEALDLVVNSVGGFYGFTRAGLFQVGRFDEPTGDPVLELTDVEILDIQRIPTELPNWRTTVGYKRAWRTMGAAEIATGASAAFKQFAVREYRDSTPAADSVVLTLHPLAGDARRDTLLDASAAADAEATRLQGLYGEDRDVFRVRAKVQPFVCDINSVVSVAFPRWGLDSGELARAVTIREDAALNEIELEVWL